MTETQKAVRFESTGPVASVLKVASIPKPDPFPDHCLIQIRASAINPSDYSNVAGGFPNTTTPRTPGRDYAGVVVKGPASEVGKRVWGTGGSNGFDKDGSHAEYITAKATELAVMPSNLSFAQAAACGVGFLTANAMIERAQVQVGEYVLVLGSSGSVGSSLVQLLQLRGAFPIQTSRRESSSTSVNTTEEDWTAQIEKVTDKKYVSAVMDTVGEASLFKKSLKVLNMDGRYVYISVSKLPSGQHTFDARSLYRKNQTIAGVNTLPITTERASMLLTELKAAFEQGRLTPPSLIEEVPLEDEKAVIEAYEKVKAGSRAKIVLVRSEY
ncbi:MAG: hypothetical protein M1836_006046 [Candelina mexicana]|nr:MAG: hypothetical protein M1836_006046 [Candelina mexicana]